MVTLRFIIPSLGRFLQVEPVEGGVDNDYVWPADPIGKNDLTGKCAVVGAGSVAMCVGDLDAVVYDPKVRALYGEALLAATMSIPGIGIATAPARIATASRSAYLVSQTIVKQNVVRSGLPYVGMSTNIDLRLAAHVSNGKITQAAAMNAKRIPVSGSGRNALRVAEQNQINRMGGIKALANKRNEIARKYWERYGISGR